MMPTITISIHHCTAGSISSIKYKRVKIKLQLFPEDIIAYVENLKEPSDKLKVYRNQLDFYIPAKSKINYKIK